jgi:hypothetical protein
MPIWVHVLSVFIQLGKLIYDMCKKDPKAAEACTLAIKDAKKNGDVSKLQQLLDNIKGDGSC